MSVFFLLPWTTDIPPYQVLVDALSCDGSLDYVAVEGDDPLEICVRISGSEGETVVANVITLNGTATGTYALY